MIDFQEIDDFTKKLVKSMSNEISASDDQEEAYKGAILSMIALAIARLSNIHERVDAIEERLKHLP
jgi:hypothetical protein